MFKKILMPIDLQETELAVKALKIATDEARKHHAEIYVMTVLPGFGMPLVASFFPDQAMKEAMKEVAKVIKRYIRDNLPDDIVTHPVITEGNPAEQILKQAKKIEADLIVIPSHTKGLSQVFLGSCAAKVVEHAKCSVMVIKGE
ncbi:MAG: universal stress protein [Anaerolineae bacterium]|uniref:universal stress protein n=1 Tax=Sedimenticola sp. TaxID=1940285 RepID=UPI00258E6297|nr:universal stress protein [Sedimenticola sp.]MBZ0308164.1 universal stress protein [Anaerolineae bacterium]MCW8902630.1 universal stress protein [Sedimenticola sp.]